MVTVYDVPANELIAQAAAQLKKDKKVTPPAWAQFVKTGAHVERPPTDPDWWFMRAAAVLRRLYVSKGPMGVSKLRRKYGGRKNMGVAPERFVKGSGSVARKVLQQLEEAKLIEKKKDGLNKGRIISPAGRSLLDKAAKQVYKKE